MGFTGRLGTGKSRLGNILLGVVDTLGQGTFDYIVHQITANKVRVKFATQVYMDSATQISRYKLSIVSSPGSFVVPNIISIAPYDSKGDSIVLNLDRNLTSQSTYSLDVGEIFDIFGDSISFVAKNFDANVMLPPLALGAFLSKRSTVDIIFDKNVGPTSSSATFTIGDSAGGPTFTMAQLTWAPESISPNTLRCVLPVGLPIANQYTINFTNVTDESKNSGSGRIPLTLELRTASPHSFASISQIQIIDAFVVDVSNDLINTATVRVYFNGPLSNGDNTANWTVAVQAPHRKTDTINSISASNASNLSSLIVLANDIKSKLNRHFIEEQVHFQNDYIDKITVPDASDLPSSLVLVRQLEDLYLSHLGRTNIHIYPDTVNDFVQTSIVMQSDAITAANLLKSKYNAHILPSYPLSFSSAYSAPIGPITTHSKYAANEVYATNGPYTSFVDLHVLMKSAKNRLLLTATVTSEDSFSTTNPSNSTGSILTRSLDDPPIASSYLIHSDGRSDFFFDKEILVENDVNIVIQDTASVPLSISIQTYSTQPTLVWALNNLLFAYSLHTNSINNAVHSINDTINIVSSSDYVTTNQLNELIVKANLFKSKLNLHISGNSFHFNPDADLVKSQPASDLRTLSTLLQDLRDTFVRHNARDGVHSHSGLRVVSAPLNDTLAIRARQFKNDQSYDLTGFVYGHYFDNLLQESKFSKTVLDESFVGIANKPSLASIIPKLGLVKLEDGLSFESDTLEFYFSKDMKQVDLNSSNLLLTGGSIQQKSALWVNDRVISMEVYRMEQISYTGTVSGLTDRAGNATI